MLLVDTTVWVDFFASRPLPHVDLLEESIEREEDICICGVILTEVLQGIREDSEHKKTNDYFKELLFLPMNKKVFIKSANIYRQLRKKSITIRNSVDCMIAAVAMKHGIPILHNDKDYDRIAEHFDLKIASKEK